MRYSTCFQRGFCGRGRKEGLSYTKLDIQLCKREVCDKKCIRQMTENIRDSLGRLGNARVKPQENGIAKFACKQHEQSQILVDDVLVEYEKALGYSQYFNLLGM